LDASISGGLYEVVQCRDAITAIKEALAAPVQEPVAHRDGYWCVDLTCKKCYSADFRFKHTTPPAAQQDIQRLSALVRAQQITIDKLEQALATPVQKRPQNCGTNYCSCVECVMEPAPVQEPVAYLCENAVGHKYFRWKKPSSIYKPIALYTREQA
jgi:hypothetical protein